MATFSREFLTGLSNGNSLGLNTSASTIHTVSASPATVKDEIWLYCVNNNASASYTLTLNWPGGNQIKTNVAASQGLTLVVPGLTLGPSQTFSAQSNSASAWLVVTGFANRIS